jgi:hypothetical protein
MSSSLREETGDDTSRSLLMINNHIQLALAAERRNGLLADAQAYRRRKKARLAKHPGAADSPRQTMPIGIRAAAGRTQPSWSHHRFKSYARDTHDVSASRFEPADQPAPSESGSQLEAIDC